MSGKFERRPQNFHGAIAHSLWDYRKIRAVLDGLLLVEPW
jgi:hypothetical protein